MSAERAGLLDACVLLNLLASGEIESILSASRIRWCICPAIESEVVYLRSEDSNRPPEPADLGPLLRSGALHTCHLETDHEKRLYLDYAAELDDGEAMTLALTESRSHFLATDDRKARRLFLENVRAPERLLSTSDLIRSWSRSLTIPRSRVRQILLRIGARARFIPGTDDPNYKWWCSH